LKDLFSIKGKTAVVTGGSSGIGAMITRGFLENGARVYITARKADRLFDAQKKLSELGDCVAIQSDLSTMEGLTGFADELATREDSLDILVNNAGAVWAEKIDDFPEDGWDKVVDINMKSVFFLTQKLLPLLRTAGSADDPSRVINIASVNGITNPRMPNYSYSASKAGVIQLTRHLAGDLAPEHINVNGIAPGLFPSAMTPMLLARVGDVVSKDHIPCGRLGEAEDAAGTAIYLCSRASAWLCGHTIVLDGGSVAIAGTAFS
jgi:NAD(P)-dependent dehydrogenase (short-subunit alcohol dehydrogenase family)